MLESCVRDPTKAFHPPPSQSSFHRENPSRLWPKVHTGLCSTSGRAQLSSQAPLPVQANFLLNALSCSPRCWSLWQNMRTFMFIETIKQGVHHIVDGASVDLVINSCQVFVHLMPLHCAQSTLVAVCACSQRIWGHVFYSSAVLGLNTGTVLLCGPFVARQDMCYRIPCAFVPPGNSAWTLWPSRRKLWGVNKCSSNQLTRRLLSGWLDLCMYSKDCDESVLQANEISLAGTPSSTSMWRVSHAGCLTIGHTIAVRPGLSVALQKQHHWIPGLYWV